MKTTILDRNDASRTVLVRFEHGDVIHDRDVNACVDDEGRYDEAATEQRVSEVAMGVERKIDVGAIVNAPAPIVIDAPTED